MAKIETGKRTVFPSRSYKVKSPEGTLFIFVMHNEEGKPVGMQLNIGKAGSSLGAWANALARMVSLSLDHGASIPEIIQELSMQASDRVIFNSGNVQIRSGPEAVAYAMIRFLEDMADERARELERDEDYRPPRLALRRTGS